ncbi:MAG: DM13 domain-containing protein [Cyanobacteria bacterium J06576_12]
MQGSLFTQVKRLGLAAAIVAFAYQPAMKANPQNPLGTLLRPSPTFPVTGVVAPSIQKGNAAPIEKTTATTKQLAQGASFISAAHPTSGNAQIVEENGQRYLEFDASFRSDDGPDLFVLLHRDAVPNDYSPDNYVNLGRLQSTDGVQRYAIPADVDIAQLQSAVIWCQAFDVTFGYATL